jgi:nucleoside-diphosphate-sugar epimerase
MKDCIIVTGSSGLIGSALIDRIGEQFVEFGFDREGPPHPPPRTEHVIDCDLGSNESVAHALNEARRLGVRTSLRSSIWPRITISRASRVRSMKRLPSAAPNAC